MMFTTSKVYMANLWWLCAFYAPAGQAFPSHMPNLPKDEFLKIFLVVHLQYKSSRKIKEKIITTMGQPEPEPEELFFQMQEDGDNWNQEEMLQAAVGLIELDNDLQSSGNSTSTLSPWKWQWLW